MSRQQSFSNRVAIVLEPCEPGRWSHQQSIQGLRDAANVGAMQCVRGSISDSENILEQRGRDAALVRTGGRTSYSEERRNAAQKGRFGAHGASGRDDQHIDELSRAEHASTWRTVDQKVICRTPHSVSM
jgi:hypothetical protein